MGMDIISTMTVLLNDMLFASVPAVGFAMVFNVPRKYLLYCALGGALGHGLRTLLLLTSLMPIEWATLAASTTVGMVGIYWSKKFHVPPKTFTVAAMIPMVPGVYVFKAIIVIVELNHGFTLELWQIFIENSIKATSIIAALAIGLAMPGLLFYRTRHIV